MKYLVIVGDGMADYPIEAMNNRTPLQFASTDTFDRLAREGEMGLMKTIPESLPPGSDTANLSVLGYDPLVYYTGRSPFEAASIGVDLQPTDVSFRCNLVTLSAEEPYAEKELVDYCSGEISSEEAEELIDALQKEFDSGDIRFYRGFRYRHLMVWQDGPDDWKLTPPHDISGKIIGPYLPAGSEGNTITYMMEKSFELLSKHPVNLRRIEQGLNPANSIWIWGNGRKPLLPSFPEKYGLRGAVISAVDLIKGLGILAGLQTIAVQGATGDFDTNYKGKAQAAVQALLAGLDFIYLHVEAPDECSHRFETVKKVRAIELIDSLVLREALSGLDEAGLDYSVLLLTDHATPLALGTHTRDPVPFVIYRSWKRWNNVGAVFTEEDAAATGLYIEDGYTVMDRFIGGRA